MVWIEFEEGERSRLALFTFVGTASPAVHHLDDADLENGQGRHVYINRFLGKGGKGQSWEICPH